MFIGLMIKKCSDVTIKDDGLYNNRNERIVPRIHGVYRVSESEGYTGNFGFQWNKFQKTQIDRESGASSQSADRLLAVTGWDKQELGGKTILEVGCGAGRFTKAVMEHTKAELHSVDYSVAAEACYRNNIQYRDRLFIYQASIYELPFKDNAFDKVFCFGVLQHTPDVKKSVECLIKKVRVGGEVIVDFYPLNGWHTLLHAKYLLRPLTRKMRHDKLLHLIEKNIGWMISATNFFNAIGVGRLLNRFLPVCDIKSTFPDNLTKEQIREWAILDTFDMMSPEYDVPQKISTVARWFKQNHVKVTFSGFVNYGSKGRVAVVKGIREK
jgi:SAM-dependent methyltransferase